MRHSKIVYVTVRVNVSGEDLFLLRRHYGWGDWSLVGGHVESGESWADAAFREVEEEMEPLRIGKHVRVSPLVSSTVDWGPEPSRSAGLEPTIYSSRWFWLEFLEDPAECLAKTEQGAFALVRRSSLGPLAGVVATKLLEKLEDNITYGLDSVPYSWPIDRSLRLEKIPILDEDVLTGVAATNQILAAPPH